MIYILIFIIIFYFAYKFDIHRDIRYKTTCFWGLCLAFILLAGLRYRIGGDTLVYMEYWDYYPDFWNFDWANDINKSKGATPEMERYQPGWFLFVMFFLGIWKHQLMMQFVVAILLNYAIFRTVKKYSHYPFITIFVYYFNFKFLEFEFEIMRESVAVAIFLLFAFDNYIQKKWIKYYMGTFFAFLIHPSAVAMFILPFFRNMKISLLKSSIIFMVIPIFIAIIGRVILGDLINLLFMSSDDFATSYMDNVLNREVNNSYMLMYVFQPILLFLLVLFFYKRISNKNLIPLVFITLFISDFSMLVYTAARLVNYIIIPVYISITPILYYLIKKFKTILILPLFLLLYNIPSIYAFQVLPEKRAKYFPYQNYIFKDRSRMQKKLDRDFTLIQ